MTSLLNEPTLFGDLINPFCCSSNPDCLTCMRTKLRATCVVVFVQEGSNWELGSYQGELPQDAAEAEFYGMLVAKVPHILMAKPDGVLLRTDREITDMFQNYGIFIGKSLVAAQFKLGKYEGVRLAWRDQTDPFSKDDLYAIQCQGKCPTGCGPC